MNRKQIELLKFHFGDSRLFYKKGLTKFLDDSIQRGIVNTINANINIGEYKECKKELENVNNFFIYSNQFVPKPNWCDVKWKIYDNITEKPSKYLLQARVYMNNFDGDYLNLHYLLRYKPPALIRPNRLKFPYGFVKATHDMNAYWLTFLFMTTDENEVLKQLDANRKWFDEMWEMVMSKVLEFREKKEFLVDMLEDEIDDVFESKKRLTEIVDRLNKRSK